jgi:hypothetical protein
MKQNFQTATEGFHTHGFASGFHGHLGVKLFVGGDCVKIHVQDCGTHGVMLHFLNERQIVGNGSAVGDFKLHQEMLAGGVGEKFAEFPGADLQIRRSVCFSVNNCGNMTCSAEFFYSCPSRPGARLGCEFNLLCHNFIYAFSFLLISKSELTDSSL